MDLNKKVQEITGIHPEHEVFTTDLNQFAAEAIQEEASRIINEHRASKFQKLTMPQKKAIQRNGETIEVQNAVGVDLALAVSEIDPEIAYQIAEGRVKDRMQIIHLARKSVLNELQAKTFEHISQTDQMTGLWNKTEYEKRLKDSIDHANETGENLSVVFFDMDHFKKTNDVLGHDEADQAILILADIIRKNIKSTDHACKWGGEEFAVIMPETNVVQAGIAAERLRADVENQMKAELKKLYPKKAHLVDQIDGTVSIGVASLEGNVAQDIRAHQMTKAADTAMYNAKQSGRNTVRVIDFSHDTRDLEWINDAMDELGVSEQDRKQIINKTILPSQEIVFDVRDAA